MTRKHHSWLPYAGLLAAYLMNLVNFFWTDSTLVRVVSAAVMALMVLAAYLLWRNRRALDRFDATMAERIRLLREESEQTSDEPYPPHLKAVRPNRPDNRD